MTFSFQVAPGSDELTVAIASPSETAYYSISLLDADGREDRISKEYLQEIECLVRAIFRKQTFLAADVLQVQVTKESKSYAMHLMQPGKDAAKIIDVAEDVFNSYQALVTKKPILAWRNPNFQAFFQQEKLANHSWADEQYEFEKQVFPGDTGQSDNFISQYDVCENRIVVGYASGHIKMWNMDDASDAWTIQPHLTKIYAIKIDGNKVLSAAGDGALQIWDLNTGMFMQKKDIGNVDSMIIDSFISVINKNYLLIQQSDENTKCYCFDRNTFELRGVELDLSGLKFFSSKEGQWTFYHATNGRLGKIHVDDADAMALIWTQQAHPLSDKGKILSFAVGKNTCYLYANDKTISLWNLENLHLIKTFKFNEPFSRFFCYGELVVVHKYDTTIQLWDWQAAGGEQYLCTVKDVSPYSLFVLNANVGLAIVISDKQSGIWNCRSKTLCRQFPSLAQAPAGSLEVFGNVIVHAGGMSGLDKENLIILRPKKKVA